jgi:hypothetical protein
MKKIILLLILLVGCSSIYDVGKVEFTNRLVSNPELINKILLDSGYICEQVRIEPIIINALKNFTYKYYVDKITYDHHTEPISKGYSKLISIDTTYQIVYKKVNANFSYITFFYNIKSNKYCFKGIYFGNVFDH